MSAFELIDEGYDFEVLVVGGEWVFRFPRRLDAAEWLRTEIAGLPELAAALPVAVPRFEHVSDEPPFVAYRLIDGTPMRNEDPAGARAFLDALHSFSSTLLPQPDWVGGYREHCERFEWSVLPLLDADLHAAARTLFADVETLSGFTPSAVHCDLGAAHLLVRDGKLVGVIDWSHISLGDPAVDYAWLINIPFPDWDVDDELRRRARWYHRLGPWFEADYGLRHDRPDYVSSGLEGIKRRL